MKKYNVTMFYRKEVEVLATNEQEAKEKAHSGEVEKDYGLRCSELSNDVVEELESILNIEEFQRLNKENDKDFTLDQLQCMEKCLNDNNCTLYDMINELYDIISEDENIYTHEKMLEIMYEHAKLVIHSINLLLILTGMMKTIFIYLIIVCGVRAAQL